MGISRKTISSIAGLLFLTLPLGLDASDGAVSKERRETPRMGLMQQISRSFDAARSLRTAAEAEAEAATKTALPQDTETVAPPPPSPPSPQPLSPPLPPSVSVRSDHTVVRIKPTNKVVRRGVVMKGAHLPVLETAEGQGCNGPWYRVMDDGWICAQDVAVSKLPPLGAAYPIVQAGSFTPWPYGFVREAAVEYRLSGGVLEEVREVLKGFGFGVAGTVKLDGVGYFKTAEGTLIPRAAAGITDNLSELEGLELTDAIHWPVGFVARRSAFAWAEPSRQKKNRLGRVDRYKPFEILETAGKGRGRFYRFDDGSWLAGSDVRVARTAPLPRGIAPGERWIDVDTSEQIITAYEGEKPVYVTLVSTGRTGSPTVKGEYRIWAKIAAIAMDNTDEELEEAAETDTENTPLTPADTDTDSGTDTAEDGPHLYSLHDVPWTQFFFESFALHGVYWHDAFGNRRSHGCVNLSLKDAAWFYRFTAPEVPEGFWAVHTTKAHPGTLVRVR